MVNRGASIEDEVLGLVANLLKAARPTDIFGFASPERVAEFDVGGPGPELDARVVRRAFGHSQARDRLDKDALFHATFSCVPTFSPFAAVARVAGPDAPESYRDAIYRASAELTATASSKTAEIRGWRAITIACLALADTDDEARAMVRQVDQQLRLDLGYLRDQYLPGERIALRKIDVDLQAAGLWAALLFGPNSVELDREDFSWSDPAVEAAAKTDPDHAALAGRIVAGLHALAIAMDAWLDGATPQASRVSFDSPQHKLPSLDEKRLRIVRSTAAAIGANGPKVAELFDFLTPTRISSSAPSERPLTRYRVAGAFPAGKGKNRFDREAVLSRLGPWLATQDPHESGLSESERVQLRDRLTFLQFAAPGAIRIPLGPGSARMRDPAVAEAEPAADAVIAGAFTLHWAAERILPRIGRSETLEHVTSWVRGLPRRVVDRSAITQERPGDKPDAAAERTIGEIALVAEEAFGSAQLTRVEERLAIRLPISRKSIVIELHLADLMGVPTVLARCGVPANGEAVSPGDLFALQSRVVVGRIGCDEDGSLFIWHFLPSAEVTAPVLKLEMTALAELAGEVATIAN